MVMEVPPNVPGIVDDRWFKYVADVGMGGPDKGRGGKYLFLPPDYKGDACTSRALCRRYANANRDMT